MEAKEYLTLATKAAVSKLPDNSGVIILALPPGNRVQYTSNLDRQDAINVVKEWLLRNGCEEDWMKHHP